MNSKSRVRLIMILRAVLLVALPVCAISTARAGEGSLATVRIVSGLNRPVDFVPAPGDTERMFIVEQPGRVRILDLNSGFVLSQPFLDIDERVSEGYHGVGEQGLFSIAFHPHYFKAGDPNEGTFFVHYTDNDGGTVIERFRVSSNPNVADASSGLVILTASQPFLNHNGGTIAFGPFDGFLYVGLGDGGNAFDPGNRAQDDKTLLGKMLRIDVDGSTEANPYDIPPSNPFVGKGSVLGEIWSKGLRNPWRFSFDRLTGDLYIADVGQWAREEVDFEPAGSPGGRNYGWRCMEARECTGRTGCLCNDDGLTLPIHHYFHDSSGGFCITGGYVYRGCEMPEWFGYYFFADWAENRIWSFKIVDGVRTNLQEVTDDLNPPDTGGTLNEISSFGQDARGELYLLDRGGTTTGQIYKIVPESAAFRGGQPPTVVHEGAGGAHFSGYIDPRNESTNGQIVDVGPDRLTVRFNEPVANLGCTVLDTSAFGVNVTGGDAPQIVSVDTSANPSVTVRFDRIIPVQEWTTLIASVQGFEGLAIESVGDRGPGVNETDRLDIGFLPGDIDQNGTVEPKDLLRFRQMITGKFMPPQGPRSAFLDIDRNGVVQPIDLIRFRQLMLGSGRSTRAWAQPPHNSMAHPQP